MSEEQPTKATEQPMGARKRRRLMAATLKSAGVGANTAAALFTRAHGYANRYGQALLDTDELAYPHKQSPWGWACIRLVKDCASSVPLLFFDGEERQDQEAVRLTDGPLVGLFRCPNPFQSSGIRTPRQLVRAMVSSLMRPGGEFFLAMADANGKPLLEPDPQNVGAEIPVPSMLWLIPGGRDRATPLETPGGITYGWEFPTKGGSVKYGVDSVVHVRMEDDDDLVRGFGPSDAAWSVASQVYQAGRFQDALLKNNGNPGGWIETPDFPSATDRERLLEEIEDEWGDADRAGETRLLTGGAKYHPNPVTPQGMAYGDLHDRNRKATAAIYGASDVLLGMDTANLATFEGHLSVFWRMTMQPLFELLQDAIDSQLIQRLQDQTLAQARSRYDLSNVQALQGETEGKARTAARFQRMGVPLNRALALADVRLEDPVEGGDVSLVSGGMQRLEDVVAGLTQPAPEPPEAKAAGEAPDSGQAGEGQEPEPTEEERSGSTPPDAGPAPASGRGFTAKAEDGAPEAVSGPLSTREGREASLRTIHGSTRAQERKLERKVGGTFRKMRSAQLDHLASVRDGQDPGERAAPVWPDDQPQLTLRAARTLLEAYNGDRRAGDDKAQERVYTCCGHVEFGVAPLPRCRKWLERHVAELGPEVPGVQRLIDAALQRVVGITDEEIDALVVVTDERFTEQLLAHLEDMTLATLRVADDLVQAQIAVGVFGPPSTELLEALRSKPIKVSEGVQSTVAKRTRRTILQALSETTNVGDIQARLLESFDQLARELRRDFNMHARRARTIARTEVGQVSSMTRAARLDEGMEQGVVSRKVWLTAVPRSAAPPLEQGGFVRSQHWNMDGLAITLGQVWEMPDGTKMAHVRAPGAPAHQIINCRCDEDAELNPNLKPDAEPTTEVLPVAEN